MGQAGDRSAVGRVDPEIGGTSVGNDFKLLSGGTNFDRDKVLGVGNISHWNLTVANHLVVHLLCLNHVSGQGFSLDGKSASLGEAKKSANES